MNEAAAEIKNESEFAPIMLRRFNSVGIEQWARFLDSLGSAAPAPFPFFLLEDPTATSAVTPGVELEQRNFRNRFELAQHLNERLDRPEFSGVGRDVGLWTWLSLFYFNQLCPADKQGRRQPGERSRWVLVNSGRSYFRHLLAGPFSLYRSHRNRAELVLPLLSDGVWEPGELYRELTARPELATNSTVLEMVRRLYFDGRTGRVKPGAGSRNEPGNVVRLIEVLSQFQLTWDLQSVDPDTLFLILPEEFDRFR